MMQSQQPDSTVHVTRASDLQTSGAQTGGMVRQNAISNLSNTLCASVMIAKPHSASDIHHHGDQDTIIYALSGRGAVVSQGGKSRQDLGPGDFAFIPAGVEHQELNDGDEDVTWVITRSGREPFVQNLEGWEKS